MLTNIEPILLTAWAAGFYEGEGTVCTSHVNGGQFIQFSLCQKNREPLEAFEHWLIQNGVKPNAIRLQASNQQFYLRVTNYEGVKKIYGLIYEYLSDRREEQFSNALEKYEANSKRYKRSPVLCTDMDEKQTSRQ